MAVTWLVVMTDSLSLRIGGHALKLSCRLKAEQTTGSFGLVGGCSWLGNLLLAVLGVGCFSGASSKARPRKEALLDKPAVAPRRSQLGEALLQAVLGIDCS